MRLWHARWRRQVSLLASGALEGPEREEALGHLDACARCREQRSGLAAVLELVARDPLRGAEPPLSAAALATRVRAALDAAPRAAGRPILARALRPALAAAAGLTALLLVWPGRPPSSPRPVAPAAEQVVLPEEMLARLERKLARQNAVRYLNEAQAVLVHVTSPADCDRADARLDVEQEAQQSRELLARRALLVELDGEPVRSARPVLEDVDTLLREVAALPACVRPRDLETIHQELSRRRVLMKIDLMTRELAG